MKKNKLKSFAEISKQMDSMEKNIKLIVNSQKQIRKTIINVIADLKKKEKA